MAKLVLNVTGHVQNMTEFVLNIIGNYLNMNGVVKYMTELALNVLIFFINNFLFFS